MGDLENQLKNSSNSSTNKSKISILLDNDGSSDNENSNNSNQSPDTSSIPSPSFINIQPSGNNNSKNNYNKIDLGKMVNLEGGGRGGVNSPSPPSSATSFPPHHHQSNSSSSSPSTSSPSFGLLSSPTGPHGSPFNKWGPTIQLPPLNFPGGLRKSSGGDPSLQQQQSLPPTNQMSPGSSPRFGIKPSPLSSLPPPSTHMHQSVPMSMVASSPIHSPRNNTNNNNSLFTSPLTQSPSIRPQIARVDSPLPSAAIMIQEDNASININNKKPSPRNSSGGNYFKPIPSHPQHQSQHTPTPHPPTPHPSSSSYTPPSNNVDTSLASSPAFESRGAFSTPFSSSPIIEPHPQYSSPLRSRGQQQPTSQQSQQSSKSRIPNYQLDSPILSPGRGSNSSSSSLPQLQHLMVSRPYGFDSSPILSSSSSSSPSLMQPLSSPSLHSSGSGTINNNNNNHHYHPYNHPPSHHHHHQQQSQHHQHQPQYQQQQQQQSIQNVPSVKYRTNSQLQFEGHHSIVEYSLFDLTIPILKASYDNHLQSVKSRLQQHSADVNYQCKLNGWTPLMLASQGAHCDIIDLLLTQPNIDLDIQNKVGYTSLMIACNNSYAGVVERLLQKGANPNIPNHLGTTPLMISCALGDRSIVLMLLHYKANALDVDLRGFSALMYTQVYGYKVIVGNEIKSGFNGEIVTGDLLNQRRSILQILLNNGARIDTTSKEDWTPLKLAIKHGPLDFVEYLIDMDETLMKKVDSDRQGWSCLNLAIRYSPVEVIDLLLKRGCSTRQCVHSTSPLLLAIQYRNVDVVSRLLHHKVLNENDSLYPLSDLIEFCVENNKMELAHYLSQQSNNNNNNSSSNSNNNHHHHPHLHHHQQQQQQQQSPQYHHHHHHHQTQIPHLPPPSSSQSPQQQQPQQHHPKNKLIL